MLTRSISAIPRTVFPSASNFMTSLSRLIHDLEVRVILQYSAHSLPQQGVVVHHYTANASGTKSCFYNISRIKRHISLLVGQRLRDAQPSDRRVWQAERSCSLKLNCTSIVP